jgi:hypothetical protein
MFSSSYIRSFHSFFVGFSLLSPGLSFLPSFLPYFRSFFILFQFLFLNLPPSLGRAIAQTVSRRLPIAAARVQTRVWSCEILLWTKVALGQVFAENSCFPCQSTFHLLLHNHLHYHPRLEQ